MEHFRPGGDAVGGLFGLVGVIEGEAHEVAVANGEGFDGSITDGGHLADQRGTAFHGFVRQDAERVGEGVRETDGVSGAEDGDLTAGEVDGIKQCDAGGPVVLQFAVAPGGAAEDQEVGLEVLG